MTTEHVAIIGCGKQAEKHIHGYRAHGVEQISVVDINPDATQALANKMSVTPLSSLDEVFSSPTFTMVDVCTPTPTHAPLLQRCIEAKKAYLVEKPLAGSLKDAIDLAEATKQAGLIGAVGYTYRFAPSLVEIKKLLDDNTQPLGQLLNATLRIGGRGSHALWKHQKATGGGAISEMLVHMIDLAVWYFGEMEQVELLHVDQIQKERNIGGVNYDVDAEDYVNVKLRSKSGANITIVADFITPSFVQYAEIQGKKGFAFGSIQGEFSPFVFKTAEEGAFLRGKNNIDAQKTNIVADLIGDFIQAVRTNTPARCSVLEAIEVQRVTEEIANQANKATF